MPVPKHTIPAVVAVAYLGVALAGGGYYPQFRAGATVVVWWVVILGLASGFWPRAPVAGRGVLAGTGLLGLALVSGLSMAWTSDDGTALEEAVRAAGYLGVFTLVLIAAPAGSARRWLVGLAIGLVAVAALALASRIEPSLFPEQDVQTLLPTVRGRLSYPLNYWNGLGACMAVAIVLLTWLGAHAAERWARAAAIAAVPLPALVLFLTSSRGGVAALVAGLTILVAAVPGRLRLLAGGALGGAAAGAVIAFANTHQDFADGRSNPSEGYAVVLAAVALGLLAGALRTALDAPLARATVSRGVALAAAGAFGAAVLVGIVLANPPRLLDEFNDPPADHGPRRGFVTRHLSSAEGNGRYQFWETGLDAFAAEPLRGIGAGGYEAWWAQHGSVPGYIRDAHSLFVEVAAELGLLGLALLILFLAATIAGAVRTRADEPRAGPDAAGAALAIVACGTVSAAIDWTWEIPAAFLPLVIAAGVLAGPALAPGATPARPRFGLGVATLGVAWVAVIAAGIVLLGEAKLADSRAAAGRGDLGDAASDASSARAVAPWWGAPRLQLALVRERAGDIPGARSAARDAAERDPDDWRIWLVVTRLALRAGDVADARAALRRAQSLNPRSPLFGGGSP